MIFFDPIKSLINISHNIIKSFFSQVSIQHIIFYNLLKRHLFHIKIHFSHNKFTIAHTLMQQFLIIPQSTKCTLTEKSNVQCNKMHLRVAPRKIALIKSNA